jgi:hypothetical protein
MNGIYILLIIIVFFGLFCGVSYVFKMPEIHKDSGSGDNRILIPYFHGDKSKIDDGPYRGYFGYVDFETFDIVIPAQYEYTGPFTGDFAVVQKKYWDISIGTKFSVINKANREILKNFDKITLLDTEDGKTVFAMTQTFSGITFYKLSWYWSYGPSRITYRIYNLHTCKQVLKDVHAYSGWGSTDNDVIRFFDNYMTYKDELYEVQNDGTLKKVEKNIEELVTGIAMERKIENFRLTGDFNSYRDWDLAAVYSIDLDLLVRNLPENLRIRSGARVWDMGSDWIEAIKAEWHGWHIWRPRNRDVTYPLREKDWLYQINLETKDRKFYVGLYNATKNLWAVPIMDHDTFSDFHYIGYDDYVYYGEDNYNREMHPNFYNVRTRTQSKYLYGYLYGYMTYLGHDDINNDLEAIIEKY